MALRKNQICEGVAISHSDDGSAASAHVEFFNGNGDWPRLCGGKGRDAFEEQNSFTGLCL
nr:hypothetical protein Iba_chr12dCG16770 [Ipomoea batatas]GMD73226.1 hypothetical protein Iba_chr12fCG16310 [Ipomoea batatas]